MQSNKNDKDFQLLVIIGMLFLQLFGMAFQVRQVFAGGRSLVNERLSLIITIIYILIWIAVIVFIRSVDYQVSLKIARVIFGITAIISMVSITGISLGVEHSFNPFAAVVFIFSSQYSGIFFYVSSLLGHVIVLIVSGGLFGVSLIRVNSDKHLNTERGKI